MYFGSVRFFKQLIISIILLIIIVLTLTVILLSFKNNSLSNKPEDIRIVGNQSLEKLTSLKDDNEINIGEEKVAKGQLNDKTMESDVIGYQLDYPELYSVTDVKTLQVGQNKIYLTFDDGPSKQTPKILDILDKYKIKATFFVVYKNDEFSNSMYKEIVKRGHTIGVHSASHEYSIIYKSVDNFLIDFNKIYSHIYEVTGVKANLFRFPGGSINSHNGDIYQPLIAEMTRRGFTFHDWNVSANDASSKATKISIYNNVVNNVLKTDKSVVLMHDSLYTNPTVQSLPKIIEEIQKSGYTFDKLDTTVAPFLFSYKN